MNGEEGLGEMGHAARERIEVKGGAKRQHIGGVVVAGWRGEIEG